VVVRQEVAIEVVVGILLLLLLLLLLLASNIPISIIMDMITLVQAPPVWDVRRLVVEVHRWNSDWFTIPSKFNCFTNIMGTIIVHRFCQST